MNKTAYEASMQGLQAPTTHAARERSNSSEGIQIPRNITIETKALARQASSSTGKQNVLPVTKKDTVWLTGYDA